MINDKQVVIKIGERDALPVRAIPYVTGWSRFTPDVVAHVFARNMDAHSLAKKTTLSAYHLTNDIPVQVREREWEGIVVSLNGFKAGLQRQHGSDEVGNEIGYADWRRGSVEKLPPGVFVWRDEFEKEYQSDLKRVSFVGQRPGESELIFAPMLDTDTRLMVLEGFDMGQGIVTPVKKKVTININNNINMKVITTACIGKPTDVAPLSVTPPSPVEQVATISANEAPSKENTEPPGKLPNVAIGKLAIKAAWEIECKVGRIASAKEVIERLKSWVESKKEADLIGIIPRGVKWMTSAPDEKDYDIEACRKTLKIWHNDRAKAAPKDSKQRLETLEISQ